MKRLLFLTTFVLFGSLLFFYCANNNDTEHQISSETTLIEFRNLEQFPVTIYRDSLRNNVFAEVAANEKKKVPAAFNITGIVFYPTFNVDVPLVSEVTIPYNGPPIVTVIEEHKTTQIPIPRLESITINSAYIKLVNESNFSLSLMDGYSERVPLGNRPSIIIPGQSAAYEITPGPSSGYSVMRNTMVPIAFPADLTEFRQGMVYAITYDGTNLVLKATWPIPSPGWPVAPKNVRAEVISITTAQLTWDAVHDATSYRIYRSVGSSTSYNQITVTDTSSYTDYGLTYNQSYFYKVSAIKDSKEGNQSVPVSISTYSPPGNVRIFSKTDTFVWLLWDKVSGSSTYNIYRSDSQTGNYNKVGTTTLQQNSPTLLSEPLFIDHGLSAEKTYFYRVCTVTNGGESKQTNPISVTTLPQINIWVTSTSIKRISLEWDIISNVHHYYILRSTTDIPGTYNTMATDLYTTTFTDTNVSPHMTYYYKVGVYFLRSSNNYWGTETDLKISATAED
jgi:fibronectin type 3 domain-containing protein